MPHPARVLGQADVRALLRHVGRHRHAVRDRALILLSFKAGLRACEMAGLTWSMVLRPDGRVGSTLFIAPGIAKNGRARTVPVNPELAVALERLRQAQGGPRHGPVIPSERGGAHMTARSVVNWFASTYAAAQLDGCSSHSGRRTFITRAARLVARTGGSLRDVQELAGHRSLKTTERYIEGDRGAQHKLVQLI